MGDLVPFKSVHIIGVGGAGMSALARMLAGSGTLVTGSDLYPSPALSELAELGLSVWSGHDPERAGLAELVVASSAIPESDPEWKRAATAGITRWRRPRLLGEISRVIPTVGATGTHGKSSSAAMMVTALRATGLTPSFVIGSDLIDLRTNAGYGTDDLFVLEVDEAFGTFEELTLSGLMVTNIEADHLDHFGSLEEIEAAFVRVMRNVTGPVVACADDPGSSQAAERASSLTFGVDPESTFVVSEVVSGGSQMRFRVRGPDCDEQVTLNRPGMHMVRNAAGVIALGTLLGYPPAGLAEGLAAFHGIRRRFENRGTVAGVTVIDDYAHHPTEIAATLRAARPMVGVGRLVAVFQPHLYSRTDRLHREFGSALALADLVVVCDVYGSRETPVPGVTGELVADAAVRAGSEDVHYVAHRVDVAPIVQGLVRVNDLVVVMGAGDITATAGELIAALGSRS